MKKLRPHEYPDWPRLLRPNFAAAYVGVTPGTFATLVKNGIYPEPMRESGYQFVCWDRLALDKIIDAKSGMANKDEWPS